MQLNINNKLINNRRKRRYVKKIFKRKSCS